MIYISVDCETSGVNPEKDQILSIGLVIEDTVDIKPIEELPKLHLVIVRDRLEGNVFALDMNNDIINLLKNYQTSTTEEEKESLEKSFGCKFVEEQDVVEEIWEFLNNRTNYHRFKPKKQITVAGKNVNFDLSFLTKLPKWERLIKVRSRVIDPTILYTNWEEDEQLPNLSTCKTRGNFDGYVSHNALEDAVDIVKLMRPYTIKDRQKQILIDMMKDDEKD